MADGSRRGLRATLAVGLLACCQAACSGAREEIERAQALHVAGDFAGAYQILSGDSGDLRNESQDGLLWLMEEGKSGLDAGKFRESEAAFSQASTLADRFDDEWAKSSIGEELGSMLVNQRVRPFRGSYADRIEIEVGRITAAILAGDQASAATAAKRVIERQKDAEVDQAKRIEAVSKEIDGRGGSKAVQDILTSQGVDLSQAYAPYLNPLASWLSGLLQCSTGDGNDRQRGETDLRRALAMVPDNQILAAQATSNPYDLARDGQPQVVVLFELGSGPRLDQLTIPLVTPWLGLSTIPLPVMRFEPRPAESLEIAGGGTVVRTEPLANLEAIWKRDFDQRLPEIILRTAVMVAAKEAATYAAAEPFRERRRDGHTDGEVGEILVLIGASLYKAATNQADLRTWRSIPAEVQIAQLPRPPDGLLTVSLVRGGAAVSPATIRLPEAPVTLVWARCVAPNSVVTCAAPLQASYQVPTPHPDALPSDPEPAQPQPSESSDAQAP